MRKLLVRVCRPRPMSLAALLPVVLAACAAAACAGQPAATQMAADSPIRVTVSPPFLTVENQAGLALTEITIAIVPAGRQTVFTKFVPRLENGEKRDYTLADFRGRDGTPFNLRVVRPTAVRIQATDTTGRKYEVESPWQ
jgi:hypothetical protein